MIAVSKERLRSFGTVKLTCGSNQMARWGTNRYLQMNRLAEIKAIAWLSEKHLNAEGQKGCTNVKGTLRFPRSHSLDGCGLLSETQPTTFLTCPVFLIQL